MSEIEKQLRAALGTTGFWLLNQHLKSVQVTFDLSGQVLVIYKDDQEPITICFDCIEDFVNNVH